METPLATILEGTALILHLSGWAFALHTYYSPPQHGSTVWAVAVGSGMIVIGNMLVILILALFNALKLEYLLWVPISVTLLIGVPMVIMQVKRKINEDQKSEEFKKENNLNGEAETLDR